MDRIQFFFPFIVILFLFHSCQSPNRDTIPDDKDSAKGSLFIIGGGSRPDSMVQKMISASGVDKKGYIVILPMSSAMSDSAVIWSSEQFWKNGVDSAAVVGFNFKKDDNPSPQRIDSLKNASLIYISGGDQRRFMDIVEGTQIADAIHEAYKLGCMIAGTSAGAAVMSKMMITGDELKYEDYRSTFRTLEAENIEIAEGLGLLEHVVIDQHFVWRSRHNRLLTAILQYPDLTGIGIDESTAIWIKNNEAEVLGESQVLVFSNPHDSVKEKNGKLGGENLRLDVYLPGDLFPVHR